MSDVYEHVRKYPLNVVLAALGFETFKYRKNGTEGYGACPIHGSKKNTTCFSFDDDGKFNCFSCSAKGRGAIDVVVAIKKYGFKEAVEWLKEMNVGAIRADPPARNHIDQPVKMVLPTENPPFKATYEKYAVPSAWLTARGLTEDTLKRFEVFEYSNPARRSAYSGSVMLKIRRWSDSECVGYLSRNIGEVTPQKPKYLFPKGLSKGLELFGASQLKEKTPIRVLYLVESPFAVMKFSQYGLSAVSPFGWSVSAEQAGILAHLAKGCIYLPDRDKGREAVSVAGLLSQHLWTKMPQMPEGVSDPEHLTQSQIDALI